MKETSRENGFFQGEGEEMVNDQSCLCGCHFESEAA